MGRSPGFGSTDCNYLAQLAPFAFATASLLMQVNLAAASNSLAHSSIGTPSSTISGLRLLVGLRFQVLFHSPSGVLFTFPSRYWCTIGRVFVFSLGRWSSLLPAEFLGSSAVLRVLAQVLLEFRLQGFHLLWLTFPGHSAIPEDF